MLLGKFLRIDCKMFIPSEIFPFFESDLAFIREFSTDKVFMNISINLNYVFIFMHKTSQIFISSK